MAPDAEPWVPEVDSGRLTATRFADIGHVTETGSTNTDLMALAGQGNSGPRVLVTDHQTRGRGRQDRGWHDEPGDSLLVSVLVSVGPAGIGCVPLATGLAVVDAVGALLESTAAAPPLAVGLKWPNDVLVPMLGERKLAGILAETTMAGDARSLAGTDPDGPIPVVIGVGLNLRWSRPPTGDLARVAVTLGELLESLGRSEPEASLRDTVLVYYLSALDRQLTALDRPGGPAVLLDRYRDRCLTLGRQVSFATIEATVRGTAVDLGPGGELLVETADGGVVTMTAGDVHHVTDPG